MLNEIGHIQKRKIHDEKLRSLQYLDYHKDILVVLSKKHFYWASKSCYVI